VGTSIGGAGVLKMIGHTGWSGAYLFVGAVLLSITVFVVLPMKEAKGPPRRPLEGNRVAAAGRELKNFVVDAYRAFTGSRGALVGVAFAILPAGAYGLGFGIQKLLAVEFGFSDSRIGDLDLATNFTMAIACIVGGWLSDRLGRRRTLAIFVTTMSLPTFYFAWLLLENQWIMPVNMKLDVRPTPSDALVSAFWVVCIVYAFCNGLMYGTRSAIFMDVTTPAVAATQFTAYMALMNLAISTAALWHGYAVKHWGYPITLLLDGIAGIVPLVLLPWITRPKPETPPPLPSSPAT
jgi:MFS family permease